jgi:hypothetical protein
MERSLCGMRVCAPTHVDLVTRWPATVRRALDKGDENGIAAKKSGESH